MGQPSLDRDYFARVYADTNDPWNFATSPYENAKYRATTSVPPQPIASSSGCGAITTTFVRPRCGRWEGRWAGYEAGMFNPEKSANRRPIDRLSRSASIGSIAEKVQPVVKELLTRAGLPVQNLLHGSVLGHPLHAILTDVPIGAWTVTAALDACELVGGPCDAGADAALIVGLAGAAGAIVSGWADWSDTYEDPRTLGMAHAMVNGVAVTGYLLSLALRRSGRRRAGLLTGLASYAVISAGAYIGGELSFGQLLGAKHTAEPLAPPADFTSVLAASALSEAAPARAELNGIPLLVSRTPDGVAAVSAVCTHRGAPLGDGAFGDGCVTCPWHGSKFALDDGRIIAGPATFPLPRFEARINGDRVEVRALPV
jgi:nitrite reductase/ring-hydroxylating ferredoxin subunit